MDVAGLPGEQVREALRLLGMSEPPGPRAGAMRALTDTLTGYGTVRSLLDAGPRGARDAFHRLAHEGPATVEALLGRGWWGHGALPPPLDWLQRRALVVVGADGLVHAVTEAVRGYLDLTLPLEPPSGAVAAEPLTVEAAATVVVASAPGQLDHALTVPAAELRLLAPTVAVSPRKPQAVAAVLRAAGIALAEDLVVSAPAEAPPLPGNTEEAVGPRSIRTLIERALTEGRQVHLQYFPSSRGGAATERVVDPWSFAEDLLRGHCHLRGDERAFAVDRIGRVRLLPSPIEHRRPH